DEIRRDRDACGTTAEPELAAALIMGPATSPKCLVICRRANHRAHQVKWTDPVSMLQPALLVEVGPPIDHQVDTDKIDVIAEFVQVLNARIMIHQFRQP